MKVIQSSKELMAKKQHPNFGSKTHSVTGENNASPKRPFSRRRFLQTAGMGVIATGLGSMLVACGDEAASTPITGQTGAAIVPGVGTKPTAPATTSAVTGTGVSATVAGATTTARPGQAAPNPTVPAPTNPLETASLFLKAWEQGRFPDMYGLLTVNAKNYITQQKFVERYTNITNEVTLTALQTQVAPGLTPPPSQQTNFEVPFKATFRTIRVGEFSQDNKLPMQSESGFWRIDWTPACYFKELDNTTYLVRMVSLNPDRGEILAKNGPLTQPAPLYEIYVVPGQIENEDQLLDTMSQLLKMDKQKIKDLYKDGQPNWRMPIKNLPGNTPPATLDALRNIKGVGVGEGSIRSYPQGQSASQVVGYINSINADDLKTLAAKGYEVDDVIGRAGVEAWGEEILAGGRAGKLTVIRSDGGTVATLAEKTPTPAANLTLNLDLKIQKAAEDALAGRVGSIVVLDPNNGAVLALANFPTYDPNAFITGLTNDQFKALNDDPHHPFQNRAVNGLLPVGSTFKVVTAAAAMEKGGMNMQTRYTCTGRWTGLGEQFAKDCYVKTGHGNITMSQALVVSCDVFFYEMGKRLDEMNESFLPDMAKGFGFGSDPGMIGLNATNGQVPDRAWKKNKLNEDWWRGDAVNLAIGQGYFQGSPLQLALAYTAIANGGNLLVPRLAEKAEGSDPSVNKTFPSQVKAKLPVSDANLALIRQALVGVVQSGTAFQAFSGSRIRVAGKTGTAESGQDQPHAWFACYAPADKPKYVVVVCLENIGYGNAIAAPTARKLVDNLTF